MREGFFEEQSVSCFLPLLWSCFVPLRFLKIIKSSITFLCQIGTLIMVELDDILLKQQ